MSASERARGARWEQAVARYLADLGYTTERRGSGQPVDRGDVIVHDLPLTVECKNHARLAFGEWLTQARTAADRVGNPVAVVVAKRRGHSDPGDAYVVTSLRDFAKMLPGPTIEGPR